MNDEKQGLRINKALAQSGFCSRRQADELIAAGRVLLNGKAVREPGIKVFEGDELEVGGKKAVVKEASGSDFIYLMLHKPIEVVSTVRDPEGRPTVIKLLPQKYSGRRLFPVGRLDYFSEGLLLLTNDGELTQRLTHPKFHLPKRYEVLVRGSAEESALEAMRRGMTLAEGEKLAPVPVKRLPVKNPEDGRRGTLLEMTLHQGINRQIRRMCRDLGLTILRLVRVGQGNLRLGGLPRGECRELFPEELEILKKDVGLK